MIKNVLTIFIFIVLEALTFFIAALLHSGMEIPILYTTLHEPRIIPAMIVEGLCGLFLALSTYAVFTHKNWALTTVIAAYAFAIAGVLLGITALALGRGPTTEANYIYHRVILIVLIAGLVLLLTPTVKSVLDRAREAQ